MPPIGAFLSSLPHRCRHRAPRELGGGPPSSRRWRCLHRTIARPAGAGSTRSDHAEVRPDHQPKGYVPRADADVIAAWQSFFEGLADHVVDPGQPVFERTAIGDVGADTQLGGYSVIEAADLEGAAALAKACPSVQSGGGVQVGELADLPDDHILSQLKTKAAQR